MTKLSYEELEEKITKAQSKVSVGSKWRHYKGGEYIIRDIVVQEHDNVLAVVYQPLNHPTICFTRPLAVWNDQIEWNGQAGTRFSRIDYSN